MATGCVLSGLLQRFPGEMVFAIYRRYGHIDAIYGRNATAAAFLEAAGFATGTPRNG